MAYVQTQTQSLSQGFDLRGWMTRTINYLTALSRYRATVNALSQLSNRELADIGLTRGDIRHVAWRASFPL